MNDAAIGHQCPDCVREGRRGQRPARTAFGGSRAGRSGLATRTLLGINVAVMVLSVIAGGMTALGGSGGWFGLMGSSTPVTDWGAVLGYAYYPDGTLHGVAAGEWWRLFTAMFLHYGALHLLLNMWVLWQLGRYLEAVFGPLRFTALYLLAGLGGNVAAYLFSAPNQRTAGASTAVFGLMLAIIVVNKRLRLDVSALIPMLVVNLIFTFTISGISIPGHLGGLAVGGLVAAVLAYAREPRRNLKQGIGSAVVLVALLVATAAQTVALLS